MKLHLVDATYELFRAYFAMPSMRAPDGREVGAVYGLLSSMLKLLREDDVTHVGCATDHTVTSFRNALFEGYKTGEGLEEELASQFPLAEEGLRALGVVVWPMVEFEADDALAAAAAKWGADPRVEQVVIATPDKDLAQCVRGSRVVLWDRRRELVYDEAGVLEKWGVPPESIADLLALMGDAADGFPGLKGWGAKSSATALSHYKALERIPDDPSAWEVKVRGAKKLAETLAAQREEAKLYKTLATLRTDVPLAEGLEDLEWKGTPCGAFKAFCAKQGYDRLADRPHVWLQ
ncbi:MAG: flap endonuclease [Planctomycetes bacterium]|nr:flap endonuclease [Planctomycetota bacterium]